MNTAKMKVEQVLKMRAMHARGWNLTQLMAVFGLGKSATHAIVTRKTWAHV